MNDELQIILEETAIGALSSNFLEQTEESHEKDKPG
jgi:hypothetical protein